MIDLIIVFVTVLAAMLLVSYVSFIALHKGWMDAESTFGKAVSVLGNTSIIPVILLMALFHATSSGLKEFYSDFLFYPKNKLKVSWVEILTAGVKK